MKETKGGIPTATLNKLSNMQSKHESKFKELKMAIAKSAKRSKNGRD